VSQVTYDSRQRDSRHISSDRDTILNSYLLVAIKADLNYAFYLRWSLVRRLIGADSRNSS